MKRFIIPLSFLLTWVTSSPAQVITFFDGAEDHPDFEINSTYNGWSFIDGDGLPTIPFYVGGGYSYPGMGSPMAYIIFNPYETIPPIDPGIGVRIFPHSGNKFFAFFARLDNPYNSINDWLISPMLSKPTKFSFWARSSMPVWCGSEIQVAYSISGTSVEDFIIISQQLVTSLDWYFYEFNIPCEAKYVAIKCIHPCEFALMIDDITIEMFDEDYCEAPNNLAIEMTDCMVNLSWSAPECMDDVTYNVYKSGIMVASEISDTVYSETLGYDEIFEWCVETVCEEMGDYMICGFNNECIKNEEDCEAVSDLTAEKININTVLLTWNAPESEFEIEGYNIYRNEQLLNNELLTVTTYTDENLSNGNYEYYVVTYYEKDCISDSSNHVTVLVEVGVEKIDGKDAIKVYPNPTTGELRIEDGELRIESVEIFDIYGRILSTFDFRLLMNKIDISHLPAGIHFLKITTAKDIIINKIIKY